MFAILIKNARTLDGLNLLQLLLRSFSCIEVLFKISYISVKDRLLLGLIFRTFYPISLVSSFIVSTLVHFIFLHLSSNIFMIFWFPHFRRSVFAFYSLVVVTVPICLTVSNSILYIDFLIFLRHRFASLTLKVRELLLELLFSKFSWESSIPWVLLAHGLVNSGRWAVMLIFKTNVRTFLP